ncbi:YidC/Oxa1 family membrane protein insertase [Patescibacteria group bacterium]
MIEFFTQAFTTLLYQPLFNILVLLYEYLPGHDFGMAVIVLTILTRVIFYPLGIKAIKSQKALSELQPKMKEIQEKYKNDKEKQAKATMELYQKEKISPLSGCLPLLIQLPILFALYRVFWKWFEPEQMAHLYSFVSNPGPIDPLFLGMVNLAESSVVLAILAGAFQFWQSKMIIPKKTPIKKGGSDFAQSMQKQMLYFFPIFTILIVWRLPSAVGLYWITTTIFSIIQQKSILKPKTKENA